MKFQKSVIAFAVATAMMGTAGAAFAGTASFTYNTYANEILAGGTAVSVNSPVMAFTALSGATISAGTKATVFLDLGSSGLKFTGSVAPALTVFSNGAPVPTTVTVTPASFSSTGSSFVAYVIDNTANTAPLNNLAFQFASGTDNLTIPTTFVNATANATYSIFNGDLSGSTSVPTSGAADSASGQVIATTQAVTASVKASNAFDAALAPAGASETGKIDVLTTYPSPVVYGGYFTNTFFTSGNPALINLGGLYLKAKPNVFNAAGTQFTLAQDNGDLKFNVTGNFVVGTGTGSNLFLASDPSCGTAIGSAVAISATNATSVPLKLPMANTNANAYVCYTVDGTAQIPTTTPNVTGLTLLDPTNAFTIDTFTNASLYPLVQNGSTVTVYNYVPASTQGYAYNVRISSSFGGPTDAPVKAQLVDDTGAVVASGTLVASLPAGQSANLNSSQIESALGATGLTAGKAYKLIITAAVGQINVQSFLINLSTGAFTNLSASQAGIGNPASIFGGGSINITQ